MKLANDRAAGFSLPLPPALELVIARLEALSVKPEFAAQREAALARALKPYLDGEAGGVLTPLPQEVDLAALILYCDVYPETGQLTLIEQLRDVITEHIGSEERAWLDPLKHSYTDVLEVTAVTQPEGAIMLRSIGDGTALELPGGDAAGRFTVGQMLLTRVIRRPDAADSNRAVWAGPGIIMPPADAQALVEQTAEWRREMEMASGSFALGEWQEFAKRFGHMILWAFAELRIAALVDAVVHIQYRTPQGQPYLYAVAVYDHHDYRFLADGLTGLTELTPEPPADGSSASGKPVRRWFQQETREGGTLTVARVTLTSAQLMVECESPERLDSVKHRLAASFGFSLHFRGETLAPPARRVSLDQLTGDEPLAVVVSPEEDLALLKGFLEQAYLEWSDQPHHALGGQTPRHAAASPALRERVAALIDEMERSDPGLLRSHRRAYDYNVLRGHVGLDEVHR
ncbi:hypothetical protein [Nitrospira moscoviensis]|uniref:Uncharacterized protein n=1 Tax=Nitrospira moscoviensis TaxID=42253 RepID=A0A0K2GGX9_NITMO|nr:hypothetical protein [Nitrospira moscoviensis]ALA60215.1 hypothetical protein NITMOv2_3826 [Nitrospira moscoviensis]